MAEKEEIEILISPEGHLKYHIKGIKGNRCIETAKALAKECGIMKELTYTSEYYQKPRIKSSIRGISKDKN